MPDVNAPLILVVDDDSGIRSVLHLLMDREGYRVTEAGTGVEALEAFERWRPDIVLMDIRMPIMDGASACTRIRQLPTGGRTPVLMITALDDRESIDRCFEAGATDYITKPINNAVLRQRVRRLLRARRAEIEIERRVQELAALGQMGQAVTTQLKLDDVLKTVIDQVMPRLQAEGVSILLPANESELMFAAVNGASADKLRGRCIPSNAGLAGEVLRSGRAARLEASADGSRAYREVEQISQYHAQDIIAVPLKLGADVIGVMEAVHSQPAIFTEDDARLLEAAADWAAIAIGNARQHQSLQRRLQESEVMAAIGRALNETLDLDTILKLIVASARRIIPSASQALIVLLNAERNVASAVTEQGRIDRQLGDQDLPWDEVTLNDLILRGQPVYIPDLAEDRRSHSLSLPAGGGSMLAAPLQSGSSNFGVISVQSQTSHAFGGEDERLLTMLGDEAAIAIQNARLFASEHTQRQLAEALRDTAATLTGSLDLDDVLDRILDNVGRVVPHDSSTILLAEAGVARVARGRGYAKPELAERVTARRYSVPDTPYLQQMAEASQPLIIADTQTFPGWAALPQAAEVRSFVGVPIRYKRKLLGFLCLESKALDFFRPEYADRLQVFANQAAVAIENARLYRLEQEQFQHWLQSQSAVAQAEKMGALGRLAASLAQEINRPLNVIHQFLDRALDADDHAPPQPDELETIRREVERIDQTTRDVLSFAQATAEEPSVTVIDDVLHRAIALAVKRLKHQQIQLTTDFQPTPPIKVAVDQLAQAVLNVLLNAIEAAGARGQIHVVTRLDDDQVRTMIIDDGPAIKLGVLPHVSEPFFTTKADHTGLGLAVSHNVVQQQGGNLTIENLTNDRGVVVTIKLPCYTA